MQKLLAIFGSALSLSLFIFIYGFAFQCFAFYSDTGQKALVQFSHEVVVYGVFPSYPYDLVEVRKNTSFITGPLQYNEPKAGALKEAKIQITSVTQLFERDAQNRQAWLIRYNYEDTYIIRKQNYQNLRLFLPVDYKKIYDSAQMKGENHFLKRHPCMMAYNDFYTQEHFFWYFWDPFRQGCNLVEGRDFKAIRPRITPLPEVRLSYPEYDRMVSFDPNPVVDITILFGSDKDNLGLVPPENNTDYNAASYREISAHLRNSGFQGRRWQSQDWRRFCPNQTTMSETVDEYTKQVGNVQMRIKMFWGRSTLESNPMGFLCHLSHALEKSALLVYNGHSNQGWTVDLNSLRTKSGLSLLPNKQKYQIYSFNGCSTFSYFNTDFFREKKWQQDPLGSKNLDIFVNGTYSLFEDLGQMTIPVLDSISNYYGKGQRTSYQQIIQQMQSDHLTAIVGSEDNPQ